ncbi:hypothetical protein AgCh_017028 [Apium graveolens]
MGFGRTQVEASLSGPTWGTPQSDQAQVGPFRDGLLLSRMTTSLCKALWSSGDRLGEVISEKYSLEYGTDKMEMHVGAVQAGDRALVVDDLIATGGSLCAAMKLLGNVLC